MEDSLFDDLDSVAWQQLNEYQDDTWLDVANDDIYLDFDDEPPTDIACAS